MASTAPYYQDQSTRDKGRRRGRPQRPSMQDMSLSSDASYMAALNGAPVVEDTSMLTDGTQQGLGPLLQAVATAAGHQAASQSSEPPRSAVQIAEASQMEGNASMIQSEGLNKSKRKRPSRPSGRTSRESVVDAVVDPELSQTGSEPARKRQKQGDNADGDSNGAPDAATAAAAAVAAAAAASQNPEARADLSQIGDSTMHEEGETEFLIHEYPPQHRLDGIRAAGIYSTAALFRKPSNSPKRYTRPPMNKLLSSLELAPENFLRLQSLAKAYMLDKAYPERQECVGSRGKGDTDIVKLKLYNSVKGFLEQDGIGEKYFGPNAEGADRRRFSWPQDIDRIIGLVTPLLRRMLTNERQRQYAVEARKPGRSTKGTPRPSFGGSTTFDGDISMMDQTDPRLDASFMHVAATPLRQNNTSPNQIQLYLLDENGKIIVPAAVLALEHHSSYETVRQRAEQDFQQILHHSQLPALQLRAHLPAGLQDVNNKEQWDAALQCVKETEWMDGKIKILATVL